MGPDDHAGNIVKSVWRVDVVTGLRVRLATDSRALRYSGLFSSDTIDVVPVSP